MDRIAKLEKAVQAHRDRRAAQERKEREKQETRARRVMERCDEVIAAHGPRIREDVKTLQARFDDLVTSDEWSRVHRAQRGLCFPEGPGVLLPPLYVDWQEGLASFAGGRSDRYQWRLSRSLALDEIRHAKWYGTRRFPVARIHHFRELARLPTTRTIEEGEGHLLLTREENQRLQTSEDRAALALCAVSLLDALSRGDLVSLAVEYTERRLKLG